MTNWRYRSFKLKLLHTIAKEIYHQLKAEYQPEHIEYKSDGPLPAIVCKHNYYVIYQIEEDEKLVIRAIDIVNSKHYVEHYTTRLHLADPDLIQNIQQLITQSSLENNWGAWNAITQ